MKKLSTILVTLGAIAAFVIFFAGGSEMELDPVAYVNWMEEEQNGLKQSKSMDAIDFEVQLKTKEYVLLKEVNIDPRTHRDDFEKEKKTVGDMQYFTLKIKTPEGVDPLKYKLGDKNEYFARIKYYSFDIQDDISLVDGRDTLWCALMHFERTFGVAPEITCLLGFPPSKQGETEVRDKTIIYYDRVFNSGNLFFGFSKQDILQVPKLKS